MNGRRSHATLVVGALVAAGTLPVARLFQNSSALGTILVSIVASLALAALLRRARLMAPLSALVSAIAFFWFAGLLFWRGDMWGPIPTPGMFESVAKGVAEGIRTATVEVAPVDPTAPVLTVLAMAVWAATWLADDATFKMRHPLLAIGFVLPLFVFPGTLIPSSHLWLDAALFVAASLALLFTDESSRLARWGKTAGYGTAGWKPGLAARIGAIVVVASIALAPLVPGYAREPGLGGSSEGGSTRIALNPILSIKPSLSDDTLTTLFTVVSPVPSYWRVTALDLFDGEQWTAPVRRVLRSISGRTIRSSTPGGRAIRQNISIGNLGGIWLPAAYEPIRVDRRANVTLEPASRSLLASGLRPGVQAKVTSWIVDPTREDLRGVDLDAVRQSPALAPYLIVPQGIPPQIRNYAEEITAGARTHFDMAVALQDELRTFEYDEDVADGHGFERLDEFLFEVKRGYCEQFAGAMAIMARLVGLPSRVAIGFTVGSPTAPNTYQVTTRHAHAWVEIFFPGYGWLAFEPTPRSDSTLVPTYAREQGPTRGRGSVPPPGAAASPSPSPTSSVNPKLEGDDRTNALGRLGTGSRRSSGMRSVLIPLALVALAGLLLPGAAAARRHLRRRRATDARSLAVCYYADFLDWCAAAGLPRRPGETPSQYAGRLAGRFSAAERPLEDLATLTSAALWAPANGDSGVGSAAARLGRAAQKAIASRLPVAVRVRPVLGWGWWRASGAAAGRRPPRP